MERMRLDLWTYDPGAPMADAHECVAAMRDRVISSWDEGADVVVFPEFAWMALERFATGADGVAGLFWNELFPPMLEKLKRPGKAVLLGTVPFIDADGRLRNRAPIVSDGRFLHQDKIHLTPWEDTFHGSERVCVWDFMGHKLAVLVCLDIEIPELAAALRGKGVDLLLVPSATESVFGVERVHRCASARAVELGCCVGVSQLTGVAESELIDVNIGRLAVYSPSQSAFGDIKRTNAGELLEGGFHRMSVSIDLAGLAASRAATEETNPSRVAPKRILIDDAG
jgi:predicted amidohydrolase